MIQDQEPQQTTDLESSERKSPAIARPFPELRKIRQDLNIEKFPELFSPSHSLIKQTRTYHRTYKSNDGTESTGSVSVAYVDQVGTLTTFDKKVYYVLLDFMHDAIQQGRDIANPVPFTLRRVVKKLRPRPNSKQHGARDFEQVKASLRRLNGVQLWWTGSFYNRETRTRDTYREGFPILGHLIIVERYQGHQLSLELSAFQLSPPLLQDFRNNNTKPFFLEAALEVKGEIAFNTYSYLDLIMADKTDFQINAITLFQQLDVRGNYPYPSHRKRKLDEIKRELNGKPLSTGMIVVNVEPTKDGKDYKLVISKTPYSTRIASGAGERKQIPERRRYFVIDDALRHTINYVASELNDEQHLSIFECIARLYGGLILEDALRQVKDQRLATKIGTAERGIHKQGAYFVAVCQRIYKEQQPA